jgi:dUTP pyrophosphatase
VIIQVKKLDHFDPKLSLPSFETTQSAGADLRANFENKKGEWIGPWERILVPTGLSLSFPSDYEVQVRPRSGLSYKTPLMIPNSPGTIDADYRGELKIILANFSNEKYFISHGDRVAQMVCARVFRPKFIEVNDLSSSQRGEGGFGSTGVRDN